jgi:hypothetical protein
VFLGRLVVALLTRGVDVVGDVAGWGAEWRVFDSRILD